MKNLFLSVLNLSITASYVILAILIVRFLLRRAPRKYSYMLWAIAAVRLICPFSFTAPLSVLSYAPAVSRSTQGMPVTQMVYFEPAPSIDVEFEDLQPTTVRPLVSASPDYMRMMAFIWIAVVAEMMMYGVYAYIKVGRSVKTAIPQEDNVYICTNISSPFVFGIIRPRIYLTADLSDEEKELILAHECYHIKRCDHLIKILAYILTCIYWFHALVWRSFYLMQRDMEMSCDEHVLMSHNKISRRYSSLLLGFAEGKPSFYAPLSFGENDISSRIKNILHFRKPRRLTTIMCFVLMVITCAACLTNPSSTKYRYCRDDLCIVVPPGTSYKESVLSEDGKEILPAEGNEEDRFLSDESLNSTIYFSTFEHFNYRQFETEDEEFKYLCDLSKESIDDLVDHYTKIEEKEDRYLYRIERLENTYASGMKMTRYGGIYRKNGLFHTILVFLPEEKQKDYETKIIDMLKNAEFEKTTGNKTINLGSFTFENPGNISLGEFIDSQTDKYREDHYLICSQENADYQRKCIFFPEDEKCIFEMAVMWKDDEGGNIEDYKSSFYLSLMNLTDRYRKVSVIEQEENSIMYRVAPNYPEDQDLGVSYYRYFRKGDGIGFVEIIIREDAEKEYRSAIETILKTMK